MRLLTYVAPWIPLVPFLVVMIRFRAKMPIVLGPGEQQREATRTFVLAMAGFSFAGLLGVVLISGEVTADLDVLIYYLAVSFFLYMTSANLQRYKVRHLIDLASDSATDVGSLSLLLAVAAVLRAFDVKGAALLIVLGLGLWSADYIFRLHITWNRLGGLE